MRSGWRRGVLPLTALLILLLVASGARAADVRRATLQNGLRVVVVRNTLAPVVTTQINYLAGSNETPEGFPGTAHALEHMMFRGSPGLSGPQLSTVAAAMGGNFNANTQQTVTQYFFTVPAAELETALHIEASRMRGILASQSLWEQERGAIDQEVAQDLSSPQYVFYARLLEAMFPGTPYAHDALGTRESFRQTTGRMLQQFHAAWYAPNNAILVIVGDVEPDRTLATVRRLFAGIPRRPLPARPEVRLQPLRAARITLDTDLSYGMAVVAYRLPGFESPDFAAGQVLADVLDSQRADLYALVVEGQALFAGFSGSALPRAALGYAAAGFPHGGDGELLVSRLKATLAAYAATGVPAELVEAAKRHEIADAEFQKSAIAGLAAAWSQALAVEGRDSPDEAIEAVKRVGVADVNRVAREYLRNDTAVVAILTPRASGAAVASTGQRRQESFTPQATRPVRLPGWARPALRLPAAPTTYADPFVTRLPNGLRLIIQPATVSRTVRLVGQVKTAPDLQLPPGQEGVPEILSGLFGYGTTRLDRLAFQEATDEIAASLSAGTSFSLQVPAEHFERGLQLLAENLLSPALPDDAFRILREQTQRAVAGRLQTPGYLFRRALQQALVPPGDPTLREATPETLAAVTLDEVKAYYATTFRPDMTTIVVVGWIGPDQAKAAVERYFGAWQASGPKPPTDLPPVPANRPAAHAVPDSSRVQDEVALTETLGLTRAHPDVHALRVANQILSGAAFASRLFRDLREQRGLVYSVDSALEIGKTRSLFSVSYACDPPNVSKARALVEHHLRVLQTRPATPAELRQAQTLLIRHIALSTASLGSLAEGLLRLSLRDLPLDEPVRAARRYLRLTAAEVRAAVAKWIRPDGFVQISLGPPPE
jgi:zinc protease